MYILSEQRDSDDWNEAAWKRYPAYLESVRDRMPPSAYALATSDWYFGFSDPRGPHDARLVEMAISEPAAAPDCFPRGPVSIRIRLLNAEGTGYIEMRYPQVHHYQLTLSDCGSGHRDWRYDELRLTDDGRVLHEIEWWTAGETGRWIIVASDVEHVYLPVDPEAEG